ncbi:MAG TPA: peptidoglycan recognition protein, partial [Phototrophicaceae bacterium]|nr:peptidoglycan recognition protein [Phototrophicaceae bacterium]
MTSRGARLVVHASVTGLVVVGAAAPAAVGAPAEGAAADEGARDVAVLRLTDGSGEPTDLTTAVADPRVGTSVLTPELDAPEFTVAGVTWAGRQAPDEEISIRVRTGEEWSTWSGLEPEAAGGGDVGGTEPYVVGGATGVQLRLEGGDGALPADLRVHLIPGTPSGGETEAASAQAAAALPERVATSSTARSSVLSAPAAASEPAAAPDAAPTHGVLAATTGAPHVIPRAGWGASSSTPHWTPDFYELRAAVVHHTAGSNDYTAAQSAGIVRGIYHYHANTRGWGDIGYNFLVDKYGQVFEGRNGTLAAPYGWMAEGGHARGFNSGTLGISVLGDYTTVRAPDHVLSTMAEVIAWKFADAGVEVRTPSGYVSPGSPARPAGQQLPRVFAHRDVESTTCPGDNIYARVPALLDDVARRVSALGGRPSEVFLKNTATAGAADLSYSRGRSADTVLVGDWDGDGVDTLALRRGNRYDFYNSHEAGEPDSVVHYGRAGDRVLVGDWDGDGRDTLAVRRGREYHVKNSLSGGNADQVIVYGREGDRVHVGDWNGDGKDTFAVRRYSVYHVKHSMS